MAPDARPRDSKGRPVGWIRPDVPDLRPQRSALPFPLDKARAHKIRRAILDEMRETGQPSSASELLLPLARRKVVSGSAPIGNLSYHLRTLDRAGLVKVHSEIKGRRGSAIKTLYVLTPLGARKDDGAVLDKIADLVRTYGPSSMPVLTAIANELALTGRSIEEVA